MWWREIVSEYIAVREPACRNRPIPINRANDVVLTTPIIPRLGTVRRTAMILEIIGLPFTVIYKNIAVNTPVTNFPVTPLFAARLE